MREGDLNMKNNKKGIEQVKDYYLGKCNEKVTKPKITWDHDYKFECEQTKAFSEKQKLIVENLKLKFKREKKEELSKLSKKIDLNEMVENFKGVDLSESTLSGKKNNE